MELVRPSPLLKVEPILFNYIENDLSELPQQLLDDIFQKAYLRKNHERVQLDYCFVVTDGLELWRSIQLDTTIPIRKSRLIPRQEQFVYEMIANHEADTIPFQENLMMKDFHILSPEPELMTGLNAKRAAIKTAVVYGT